MKSGGHNNPLYGRNVTFAIRHEQVVTGYISRKFSPVSPAFAEPIPPSAHTCELMEGSLRLVGGINLRSVSVSSMLA